MSYWVAVYITPLIPAGFGCFLAKAECAIAQGFARGVGCCIRSCSMVEMSVVLLIPDLRAQWLALCQAIWPGKETGSFHTSHLLKQRLVHKVSCFFPDSVSPWTVATEQHVPIASMFSLETLQGIQLDGPHGCYSYMVWELLICLNPARCFFTFCGINITVFSTARTKFALPISPAAKFYPLGFYLVSVHYLVCLHAPTLQQHRPHLSRLSSSNL